jgi:long-subunit fatty acid transport protein
MKTLTLHVRAARPAARAAVTPVRCRGASATLALLVILGASAASGPARGQGLPRIDFEISHPGARSLGFAGAFAALADDATAAYANPAGLVQLTRREVSVEGRHWRRAPSFLAGGRDEGEPTGIGIDVSRGLLIERDESSETAPSFLSVVQPRGRLTYALYAHRQASFEMTAESQGLFTDAGFFPLGVRSLATRNRVDLRMEAVGAAAGLRIDERLSVGLALVYTDAQLHAIGEGYLPDDNTAASLFDVVTFRPERLVSTTTLTAEGNDVTVSAGVLWSPTPRLSTAAFYRQGAEVDGDTLFRFSLPGSETPTTQDLTATFDAPDVLGAGLAYRSADGRLTLAGEVDRVGYRGLVRVRTDVGAEELLREYEDAWEYRLGAEYALLARRPVLAFRAGAWMESPSADLRHQEVVHWAVGFGIAGDRVQVDVAADLSAVVDTGAVSLIYSF